MVAVYATVKINWICDYEIFPSFNDLEISSIRKSFLEISYDNHQNEPLHQVTDFLSLRQYFLTFHGQHLLILPLSIDWYVTYIFTQLLSKLLSEVQMLDHLHSINYYRILFVFLSLVILIYAVFLDYIIKIVSSRKVYGVLKAFKFIRKCHSSTLLD